MFYSAQISTASTGLLRVNLTTSVGFFPVKGARITISTTGSGGTNVIDELTTDANGQTEIIDLAAPDLGLSLEPNMEQPYSEYTVTVNAEGYEPVVAGTQILPTRAAIQPISLTSLGNGSNAIRSTELPAPPTGRSIVIGPHTLYGEYPPKIPESEVKSVDETGAIVLSSVVIPEFVIVHDGPPNDTSASNYYVRYADYIKNVASSEIYATWPTATIQANILAIASVCLNRVFTEWYAGKGHNFTITSSTAFDQKFIYGRNIYDNISKEVDGVFGPQTQRSVIIFQEIFDLNPDGIVGRETWYSISNIYVAVSRLAELS